MLELILSVAVFIPNYALALYCGYQAFRGLRDEYPPLHKLHASAIAICAGYLVIQTRMLPAALDVTMDSLAVVALTAVTLWTLGRFCREQRMNSGRVMKQVAREIASGSHPVLAEPLTISEPSPGLFAWFRHTRRVDAP